jgi:molybdenum cofactor cytidylyltransferase
MSSSVVAVVLAAGRGARMGSPKALLRIGETTFLRHVAQALRRPGVSGVVAVLGHDRERVGEDAERDDQLQTAYNPRHGEGMLTSIWCGLDAADRLGASAVLLHPVDHPLVEAETVDRVVDALAAGARIAVPSHAGRRGHPGGFARETWEALRQASPARGARSVLQDHPDWIVHVPGGPGCLQGVDTPDDYRRVVGSASA